MMMIKYDDITGLSAKPDIIIPDIIIQKWRGGQTMLIWRASPSTYESRVWLHTYTICVQDLTIIMIHQLHQSDCRMHVYAYTLCLHVFCNLIELVQFGGMQKSDLAQ